jgi:hypothetical protein
MRNIERFPNDFMFQLTSAEASTVSRYQFGTLKQGQNIKYLLRVFSEKWRATPILSRQYGVGVVC